MGHGSKSIWRKVQRPFRHRNEQRALSREQLHEIRDLTIMLRKRKLKPEKGRRKDLRKIDSLIRDLHSITHPTESRNSF